MNKRNSNRARMCVGNNRFISVEKTGRSVLGYLEVGMSSNYLSTSPKKERIKC
jgi:hypothetical protein